MSERVRVESLDAIRDFRIAMVKFADTCKIAMSDVEGDFQHTLNWLENEQLAHWQGQIRKRTDVLSKAKEALRSKRAFKDSSGRTPQAADEEKAVRIAQARLAEAEEKLLNVRKYTRVLQKEIGIYKGSVQRFMTTLESEVPLAISALDKMFGSLEAYVSLNAMAPVPTAPPPLTTEPAPAAPEAEHE